MAKLTITDAAKKLGISKEAIHNRIRRGSIKSVIENGIKYVLMDEVSRQTAKRATNTTTSSSADERYYKLLEEQNQKLQQRVEILEGETRLLRDQKEQMLIDERKKIEQIYKEKDEQLKNILNAISSKFMLANSSQQDCEDEPFEAEIADEFDEYKESSLISLKKHIKTLKLSDKKAQKLKTKVKKVAKKDERIIIIDKKYYLDFEKYNYSDLGL